MASEFVAVARWVVPVLHPPVEGGAVHVRAGRIAAWGRAEDVLQSALGAPRLDLGYAALLPGLVNVHAHLELTLLRGVLEEAASRFPLWIERLTRLKYEHFAGAELAAGAELGVAELVSGGVTCVGEVIDLGASVPPLSRWGLRGVAYQEVFGPDPRDAVERSAELRDKVARLRDIVGPRMRVGVSPHAPYTVSAPLFRRVAEYAAAERLPVSVHAAESREEAAFCRTGEGPFAERLRSRGIDWQAPGCSPIAYLERTGVLEAKPLLAHCVHADEEDLERLSRSGSAVAHCPRSNAKFGHGVAPLCGMLERGIPVGLGTDSAAGGMALDLFEEARAAVLLQRVGAVPGGGDREENEEPRGGGAWGRDGFWEPRRVLRLLTLDAARALGLGAEVGAIDCGRLADLVAVDLSGAHCQPVTDVEAALLWCAGARDVFWTAVEGEVLYDRGRFLRGDVHALREEVAAILERQRAI